VDEIVMDSPWVISEAFLTEVRAQQQAVRAGDPKERRVCVCVCVTVAVHAPQ